MTDIPEDKSFGNGLSENGLPNIEWCLEIPPGDYSLSTCDSEFVLGTQR